MVSDYQVICADNIRRRGEEFDDIGRLISEQLYSDRTHFIYELLQNAEDALGRRQQNNLQSKLPSNVRFSLYEDRLEFRHFGEIFTTEDVKAVSDVLKGTKRGLGDQIGRHGIGFKSVYAFTATPEIHSGSEHFIIERYIRPRHADQTPQMAEGETVFIFPFNHNEHPGEEAFKLIGDKLKVLLPRVLLFLKNIIRIDWSINDSESGFLTRDPVELGKTTHRITLQGSHRKQKEKWLVFNREIALSESKEKYLLEIAFKLIDDEKLRKQRIQKIRRSPLVVYFPTKLDTHLGFLIQGPYDTVASRSDIENNKTNETLIEETALLLTEQALPELKQLKLITVSLLEAMPIRMDEFKEDDGDGMFMPIAKAVRETFRNQELLPTNDGIFVSAQNAKLARGTGLRRLLDHYQLRTLYEGNCDVRWLPGGITREKSPDLRTYLIEELDIDEVTPEVFVRRVSERFFREQSDDWMSSFYRYIGNNPKALWKPSYGYRSPAGPLRSKAFVRLQDGKHVRPFRDDDSPNVYHTNGTDIETSLPIVKVELSQHEDVCSFLNELGVPELDLVEEVIERILPKYTGHSSSITIDEHVQDIEKIKNAYRTDSLDKKTRLKEKLRSTPFVRVSAPEDDEAVYKTPDELYVESDDLRIYFSGSSLLKFIHPDYLDDTKVMFVELGVAERIRVYSKSKPVFSGNVLLEYRNGCHRRGLSGFDPDIEVDGLENALTYTLPERSRIIWDMVACPFSHCIKGEIIMSSRQDFSRDASIYEEQKMLSKFGQLLMENSWLPDMSGDFHKPCDLKLEDLHLSFVRDEKLAKQLGVTLDISEELLDKAGISQDIFKLAQKFESQPFEIQEQINLLLQSPSGSKPVFPSRRLDNSEHREKKVQKRYEQSDDKEYEKKERSIKTSSPTIDSKEWLKNQYTNDDHILVCQMCENAMPFKLRDGSYYFEDVQIDNRFKKEWHELYLAMCPNCAATYRYLVKNDEGAIDIFLENLKGIHDNLRVPIELGDNGTYSVSFVERHLEGIKNILDIS